MNGKDLFEALNQVDDALVAEAETYAARRVIPMHTVRWIGTLAACVCLLVCWAAAVQWNPLDALSMGGATETAESTTAAAMNEGAAQEEAVTEEATVEEAEAEEEAEVDYSENGASAGGAQEYTEHAQYVILAEALPAAKSETKELYAEPMNGKVILEEELANTLEQCAVTEFTGLPRFLVAFDLYRDGMKIDPDSEEYAAEIERLEALGYTFRALHVQHKNKSVEVQVCGLLSEAQLAQFDASEEYGYFFCFPENEDGTALDWEDEAELCGLPEAETEEIE
ncbi:MAG: hypothetical protein J6I98_01595 [Clostridia bacterium]|nr:hypothetical protein [Clostridia bacterium]